MEEILLFAAKAFVIVIAFALITIIVVMASSKKSKKSEFEAEPLHEKYKDIKFFMQSLTFNKKEMKQLKKDMKKEEKDEKNKEPSKKVYVLNFDGDVQADEVSSLREEVTAILQVVKPEDEVVVKVESPGGVVHGYGLAAAQLNRIRESGAKLTVCVDKVAASGGYMMAVVAHRIISAPFAIIGSIGVVAQVPNFHKILKKNEIEYKEYTAGDFKRTVSVFGEITPKGEQKFIEQLESTHSLFKNFVSKYRPQLNLAEVATGEYWFGEDALKKNLVDELSTSDDYLLKRAKDCVIFELKYEKKKSLAEKLSSQLGHVLQKSLMKTIEKLDRRIHF